MDTNLLAGFSPVTRRRDYVVLAGAGCSLCCISGVDRAVADAFASTDPPAGRDRELLQVQNLQGDAISGLMQSFSGLESQSREQETLTRSLVARVADNTGDSSGISTLASEASELVQMFVESITAMRDGSVEMVNVFIEMKDQISTVEKMLGEIDGISSQTNLLALNAAIEAARAG